MSAESSVVRDRASELLLPQIDLRQRLSPQECEVLAICDRVLACCDAVARVIRVTQHTLTLSERR